MLKAVYPGSFDPVTKGHLDIIRRAAGVVDELIIGVLVNSAKDSCFSLSERADMLRECVSVYDNVIVREFDGMTVDFARQNGARLIIRGLRAVTDFEYEMQIAQTNHSIDPEVDTMFFTTSLEYAFLSSTIVKEIARYGKDIDRYVPGNVVEALKKRMDERCAASGESRSI